MADPIFMEPIKGSQVLLHARGKFYESLAYLHKDRLYARHGAAFMALRPGRAASGVYLSDSSYTVESFDLPDGILMHPDGGYASVRTRLSKVA